MTKQNSLIGFLFIGFGVYFLLRHLNIPELIPFYSWSSLLVIIGIALLLHSYVAKDYSNLSTGALVTGLGVHFTLQAHTSFWIDHWAVYLWIIGISFLLYYSKTKRGLIPAIVCITIGLFAVFTPGTPAWSLWVQRIVNVLERFWPVVLIAYGMYVIRKK
ncbi:DUF5668 domain-containing protein [Halobacillus sp. BAB-2008]|uniref:LiaI-LiaF-like domain-containing protein n=1 Tax=Halobacillus sp. BAB-2008 TaxID=1246484 RepID=UPI0002A4E146|nr:DUF5668 domain-containing protein [Halobacillus sp. BAB-2008]ELK47157.1 hypothetical protein D479_06887 [Halobacillus sp. BAB-2008]